MQVSFSSPTGSGSCRRALPRLGVLCFSLLELLGRRRGPPGSGCAPLGPACWAALCAPRPRGPGLAALVPQRDPSRAVRSAAGLDPYRPRPVGHCWLPAASRYSSVALGSRRGPPSSPRPPFVRDEGGG